MLELAISTMISPRTLVVAQLRIFSITLELYFWHDSSDTRPSTQRVMRSASSVCPCSIRYYASRAAATPTWIT